MKEFGETMKVVVWIVPAFIGLHVCTDLMFTQNPIQTGGDGAFYGAPTYFVIFPQIYLGTIWCCQVLIVY